MQQDMMKMQQELETKTYTAAAGGGVVSATVTGKRELKEETGAVGRDYCFLGELYPTPGYCEEIIYLYGCRVDKMGQTNPDEDEFVEVEAIPLGRAVEMVLRNEIPDAKTQVLVLKTDAFLRSGGWK